MEEEVWVAMEVSVAVDREEKEEALLPGLTVSVSRDSRL